MMHQLGFRGMIRRTADPTIQDGVAQLQGLNVFITWSAVVLVSVQLLFVANLVYGLFLARRGEDNPWEAASPEGAASSAPCGELPGADPGVAGSVRLPGAPGREIDHVPCAAPAEPAEEG